MQLQAQRTGYGLVMAVISALLVQAACRDTGSAVNAPPIATDGSMHAVAWATPGSQQFSAGRGPARGAGVASAPSTTVSTFWVYTNRETTHRVSVFGEGGWHDYVTFTVPWGSLLRRPDGSSFPSVDSIAITMTLDPESMQVEMEPSGLVFNPQVPARLTISYADAAADLDGNGVVDLVDQYIRQVLLGVRERQRPGDPWLVIPSLNDLLSQSLSVDVRHFTGYAVSW